MPGVYRHTRLSPFVVNTTASSSTQIPSPPLKRRVDATWLRVEVVVPAGSGTWAQPSCPPTSVITSSRPSSSACETVGVNRYSAPSGLSSVRYRRPSDATATASCANLPSAGRATAGATPNGSHSHTTPRETSSQESQVFHGVAPPAQLRSVPVRIAPASTIAPDASWTIRETPPPGVSVSWLTT